MGNSFHHTQKITLPYLAKIADGRVLVFRVKYSLKSGQSYGEPVNLPSGVKEITDAIDAYCEGPDLVVRRRDGRAYAWNVESLAPLGPR